MTVERAETEPDTVAGLLAGTPELRCPHLGDRLGLEQVAIDATARGKQRTDKTREVDDRRVHAPGGRDPELNCRRGEGAAIQRPHFGGREIPCEGWRRREAAACHA